MTVRVLVVNRLHEGVCLITFVCVIDGECACWVPSAVVCLVFSVKAAAGVAMGRFVGSSGLQ